MTRFFRYAGKILKSIERTKAGRHKKNSSHDVTNYDKVLNDNDLTGKTANRWQRESDLPEEEFVQHIAEVNETKTELTSISVVRAAKKAENRNNPVDYQA